MKNSMTLQELPLGQMGEIVAVSDELQKLLRYGFGIDVGMTIMHLQQAVDSLVQVGYTQMHLESEYLQYIHVRPVKV